MELTRARLRLYYGTLPFGPGKADLLEAIRDSGSISAAGRSMGMSYKRAWSLVEEMNAAFAEPLVASARGGAHGGGARLTRAGEEVLSAYRTILVKLIDHCAPEIAAIGARLRPGGVAEPDRPPADADTPQ
ncbi:winged helix-turn-helix domain-containing protein [Paenirhodobacter enshiensis]|uniref:winged helix-turn-helix domain-containing protein n=1 Tax=Paenirhodobacter enshiensis TaxID=1105367 RepID=UPI000563B3DB|nr:LysR family transcriptional regulator [Paenirhodobacter enshiensis]